MKRIITYFLVALLTLTFRQAFAQIVIDLRTGVDNSGNILPVNSPDDTWFVKVPGSGVYQTSGCSIGQQDNGSWYPGFPSGNSNSRVLSPYLNGSGQCTPNSTAGSYYYRMAFNVSSCPVTGATITTRNFQVDDDLISMALNATHFVLPSSSLPVSPGLGPSWFGYTYNYICTSFIQPGQNEIMIRVDNVQDNWAGFEFDGTLTLETCASIDLDLKDKNGNSKIEFCIDEGIFLNTVGATPTTYTMSLWKDNGSGNFSQIAATQPLAGSPNGINVTDVFENQNSIVFQTGVAYQVKLAVNSFCGPYQITKDFSFICCDNSPDPSFNLSINNGVLTGQSTTSGTHVWQVYSTPNLNTGPYTSAGSFYTQMFSLPLGDNESSCYYVSHDIKNACGEKCDAQCICNLTCDELPCILTPPSGVTMDSRGSLISWSSVTGAASYVVEITVNDPACCTSGGQLTLAYPPKYIPVSTNSYVINLADLGLSPESGRGLCFSFRVFTVCPDGLRSVGSSPYCSGN